MTHEILQIDGEVIKLRLSGVMTRADMTAMQALAVQLITQGKRPRLLAILDHFQGWAKDDDWNEIDFLTEHGDDIVKMAVVGNDEWKDDVFLFVGKGLRATEVEFFPPTALGEAETWIARQP